jgi:hypothetical protein
MKTHHPLLHEPRRQTAVVICLLAWVNLLGCQREAVDDSAARPGPGVPVGSADDTAGETSPDTAEDGTASQTSDEAAGVPAADSTAGAGRDTKASTAESQPDRYLRLVGRWVRTDSPYVISIRRVGPDGSLDAAYYNPQSIRVSRATAEKKSGELTVFVELRDVNYPGSTYTLVYDQSQDVLRGVYYQATMQQEFNVVFARARPEDRGP